MTTYVALLRGINLGANRRVAMADLRALVEGLGYTDVRTHLQSGNVVLRAPTRSAATVGRAIEGAIHAELGLDVSVVTRTAAELTAVVDADPLGDVVTDPARYLVVFLDKAPPAAWSASVEPDIVAPERIVAEGKQLFVWLPHGVHQSRLGKAVMGSGLGVAGTARNWRTVTALAAMAAD